MANKQLEARMQHHMSQNPMMAAQSGYDMKKKGQEIMSDINGLNPKKCPNRVRLQCAQFVIMHFTMEAMSLGVSNDSPQAMLPGMASPPPPVLDQARLEKFRLEQREGMELAWKILTARSFADAAMAKTAAVLKIDIAQRLEDSVKLSETFNAFTKKQLQAQDIMVACTAAPFLANWQAAKNLSARAEKIMGKEMLNKQWHMMAQSMPIPDYSVLLEMANAAELYKKPTPNPKSLEWNTIKVGKIRVKFLEVDCGPFKDKAKELLDEIKKTPIDWENVPSDENVQIKKMGGFYQTVSFGDMPMTLCGPCVEDDKIHVKGFMELVLQNPDEPNPPQQMFDPNQVDKSKLVVQREEWKLQRVPNTTPVVWAGNYTLNQGPMQLDLNNPDTSPVNMSFQLQIYEKDDDGNVHDFIESGSEPVKILTAIEADSTMTSKSEETEKKNSDETKVPAPLKAAAEAKPKEVVEEVITEIDGLTMD